MTAALELEMLPDQMLYKVGCPAALAKAAQTTVAAVALARAVVQNERTLEKTRVPSVLLSWPRVEAHESGLGFQACLSA
jgi:hypothetical protein